MEAKCVRIRSLSEDVLEFFDTNGSFRACDLGQLLYCGSRKPNYRDRYEWEATGEP